jgi:hypothetical protein
MSGQSSFVEHQAAAVDDGASAVGLTAACAIDRLLLLLRETSLR